VQAQARCRGDEEDAQALAVEQAGQAGHQSRRPGVPRTCQLAPTRGKRPPRHHEDTESRWQWIVTDYQPVYQPGPFRISQSEPSSGRSSCEYRCPQGAHAQRGHGMVLMPPHRGHQVYRKDYSSY
jgi:hypothetical protein